MTAVGRKRSARNGGPAAERPPTGGVPWLLIAFTFATALVVGAVIALIVGSWWVLAAAVGVHLLATALVVGLIGLRMGQVDKPDPVTEARLEEERPVAEAAARRRERQRRREHEPGRFAI